MTNPFYNPTGNPAAGSAGLSTLMRGEFNAIAAAFTMLPRVTTTGLYNTIFSQSGSYTYILPPGAGTLALLTDVVTEAARATGVETTRAQAAEGVITTSVTAETTARSGAVSAETARAQAAESTLTTNVSTVTTSVTTEVNRATAAEATGVGLVNSEAATRAAAVSAEITRAQSAEAVLTTAVATEVGARAAETTRAMAAEAKSAAYFNVMAYGAVADGVTNDTAAIQACLTAAAGNGRAYVPLGKTFLVTGLTMPSNCYFIVDGTLKLAAASNRPVIDAQNKDSVTIEGRGVLDGQRTLQTAQGTGGAGVNIFQSTKIVVRDVTIKNCYNWPVNIVTSSQCYVENIVALNCGNSFELASGSHDCWVDKCQIDGIDDIAFSFYGGVYNSGITNCDVKNARAGDGINVLSDAAQNAPCHDIIIANNIVSGCLGAAVSVARGVNGTGVHTNISITDNRGYGNRSVANNAGAGVYITNGMNIVVQDNLFGPDGVLGSTTGIYIDGTNGVTNTTIQGNVIVDQGTGNATPTGIGIFCNGVDVKTVIRNNTIVDTRSSPLMMLGFAGTAGTGCVIENNTVSNMAGAISTMVVTNAIVRNVGMGWNFTDGENITGGSVNVVSGAGNLALAGNATLGQAGITTFGSAANVDLVFNLKGAGKARLAAPLVFTGPTLQNSYASDAAAATGGVGLGELYRNVNAILIRLS